jgi:hypothetical protein
VRRYLLTMPLLLGFCLMALADCASQNSATVAQSQIRPVDPGMARVWFLRGSITPNGAVQAFAPMIYANGAPVANIPIGTGFYRDFAPGAYRFTVEPYGLPTSQATVLQLAPGMQAYLQVDWVASWTQGYAPASWSFAPNMFAILTMAPQLAQAYLPTLSYLGER